MHMHKPNAIHDAARKGFSSAADTYVRGRPDFPPASLAWLVEDLGLGAGKLALDLGAGTGKFTRVMLETGAAVIAVDPLPEMIERLRAGLPQVDTIVAAADGLPFADESLDAVVCAQAFHWFATREALVEIHRVLKPGAVLGLIWNVRDQSIDWVSRLTTLMEPYEGDAPRYDHGEWRKVFPGSRFGALQAREFPHEHVGPPERVIVDRVASVSFVAALPESTRARLLDEVRALIAETPSLAGLPFVTMPYVTRAYSTRKSSS
jgi:SAM-dependent methyltransferase